MCDLPIAGFKFADDNESFLLSDIVEAIRIKHPDFVITDTICESVIRHGDIKTAYTIHSVCLYGEIVVHPNFVMKITKKEAIRLYALMFDDVPMIKQVEPEVIKGKPETLKKWMKFKVEEMGLQLTDEMPDGFQARLIKEAEKHGYKESTAVKTAWSELGLTSVRKTIKMKKPPKTP